MIRNWPLAVVIPCDGGPLPAAIAEAIFGKPLEVRDSKKTTVMRAESKRQTGHQWITREEKAGSCYPLGEPYCAFCGAYFEQAKSLPCLNPQPAPGELECR
jgi:hypothetical protein